MAGQVSLARHGDVPGWWREDGWMLLWTAAALVAIFATGPMPLYSTRTLGVAWEMWSSGQFLVPYSNGEPYSHKVPLLFWLIHAGWAVGGVGDVWPRLLQVICGFAVLVLARRLARVLWPHEPTVARLVPWLLAAFCYAFLFALQIMYELLLCVCVLAALNALVARDAARRPAFAWFAVAVAAGLMSKGPVMLLHVVFPFLLGPWWHPWAARERRRWYFGGGLALVAGCAVLLAWAFAAAHAGGAAYRDELFFMQTTGRMVDSFDHAEPWWWYLSVLPMLALPWALWPRSWQAVLQVARAPRATGWRFLACWLLPVFVAFSAISGKQPYYLLPEAAGGAMLLAAGFAVLVRKGRRAAWWSGSQWLGLFALAGAAALLWLPHAVASGRIDSVWYIDLAAASPLFALAAALLGGVLLPRARDDESALRRISAASIVATALVYVLFAQTLWPRFDVAPAARHLGALERAGVPLANLDVYHNQFRFLGRLDKPIAAFPPGGGEDWAAAHPEGRVVRYVAQLGADDLRSAELVQPFRSDWLVIERADLWLARRRGEPVAPPSTRPALHPHGYWPYRALGVDAR